MPAVKNLEPKHFFSGLIGKPIVCKLESRLEYHGTLVSVDSYMNIQMASAGEYIDGVDSGVVADVFIRGNNVLWIADDKKNVEKPPTDDGR